MTPATTLPDVNRLLVLYDSGGKKCFGTYCLIRHRYVTGPPRFNPIASWKYATKRQETRYFKRKTK